MHPDYPQNIRDEEVLSAEDEQLIRKVVQQLEMSPTGRCLECGMSRMFHLVKPLTCGAVIGMLRARLGL
jgi:hypothetical protein